MASLRRLRLRLAAGLLLALVGWSWVFVPALAAITVQEEEDLSREFLKMVFAQYEVLREPLVTDYLSRLGRRLLEALPPQPFEYHFYMIVDPTYNAFATPAGHIFINTGLVAALENESELAGILGHEIAHVVCRHISGKIERSKKIGAASLAGVVAGVLLGSAGAGDAAGALMIGSLAAGQSLALAYSREDEMQADQLGLLNLTEAGFSGMGLLTGLKTIRSRQWYGSKEVPTYLRTHPAVEERMAYIDNWLQQAGDAASAACESSPEFVRVHTWVEAIYGDVDTARQHFTAAVSRDPADPMAHWGYALALERSGETAAALDQLQRALVLRPLDGYMIKDLGRLYFTNGRYTEALKVLEGLAEGPEPPPEALFYLGRTQLELGLQDQALRTLDTLVARHPNYPSARYFLGEAFGRAGRLAEAHYHLGLYHYAQRDMKNARFHLERALAETKNEQLRQEIQTILKNEISKSEKKKPS